jgi:hypothetical protein
MQVVTDKELQRRRCGRSAMATTEVVAAPWTCRIGARRGV